MNQEEWQEFYNLLVTLSEEQMANFIDILKELQKEEEEGAAYGAQL